MGHVISFWNFGVCIVLNFGVSIAKIKKNKIRTSSKSLSKKARKWRLKKPEGNNIILTKKNCLPFITFTLEKRFLAVAVLPKFCELLVFRQSKSNL